jgi:hypothetical protein
MERLQRGEALAPGDPFALRGRGVGQPLVLHRDRRLSGSLGRHRDDDP